MLDLKAILSQSVEAEAHVIDALTDTFQSIKKEVQEKQPENLSRLRSKFSAFLVEAASLTEAPKKRGPKPKAEQETPKRRGRPRKSAK